MKVKLLTIYLVFLKIGAMLLGGGYVILPLLQSEAVEKKGWITKDELLDFYSLSQCVPGIIAANISIFTGYKIRKIPGAIAATAGIITSPFIIIVLLASALIQIADKPIVAHIFWGVALGIVILIYLTVKEVFSSSVIDKFTFILFALVFALSVAFNVSPAIIIVLSALSGIIYKKILCAKEGK